MNTQASFKHDAFISYSRKDQEWADKLHKDLTNAGFDIFKDNRSIQAGDEWEKEISNALHASKNFIILWSQASYQFDWVNSEVVIYLDLKLNSPDKDNRKKLSGKKNLM